MHSGRASADRSLFLAVRFYRRRNFIATSSLTQQCGRTLVRRHGGGCVRYRTFVHLKVAKRRPTLWNDGCRPVSFGPVIHPTQWSRIAARSAGLSVHAFARIKFGRAFSCSRSRRQARQRLENEETKATDL
jgi:hypothetical protein